MLCATFRCIVSWITRYAFKQFCIFRIFWDPWLEIWGCSFRYSILMLLKFQLLILKTTRVMILESFRKLYRNLDAIELDAWYSHFCSSSCFCFSSSLFLKTLRFCAYLRHFVILGYFAAILIVIVQPYCSYVFWIACTYFCRFCIFMLVDCHDVTWQCYVNTNSNIIS